MFRQTDTLRIVESVFSSKTEFSKADSGTTWDMGTVRWFIFIGAFAVVGAYPYLKW